MDPIYAIIIILVVAIIVALLNLPWLVLGATVAIVLIALLLTHGGAWRR